MNPVGDSQMREREGKEGERLLHGMATSREEVLSGTVRSMWMALAGAWNRWPAAKDFPSVCVEKYMGAFNPRD